MPFEIGSTVVLREVAGSEVWAERPVRVVRDDDLVALWLPRGTKWRKPVALDGQPWRIPIPPWNLVEAEWSRYEVLQVIPERGRAAYAAWTCWDVSGAWAGWYINLQEPLRRVADGFEYLDLALDLLLHPDGTHTWKDEDEFADFVDRGLLTVAEAARTRDVAESVLEAFVARKGLFADEWADWRADPSWPTPTLADVAPADQPTA